jgi:HK97 family phage portal protein
MITKFLTKHLKNRKKEFGIANHVVMQDLFNPVWTNKNYHNFAKEAYQNNVIASRCISLIAKSAASVDWLLYSNNKKQVIEKHPLLKLLHHPNPMAGGAEFFEAFFSYKILSGNAYILATRDKDIELHLLRPDRVSVIHGESSVPSGYLYKIGDEETIYDIDPITGFSEVLHLKNFNPLDDWYGLSQVEAASYSIDLHNQASIWNQSLLQNGAKPSGALIFKNSHGNNQYLSDEQFERLQEQLYEKFSGSVNAGKPLLLEGGLEWQEMSYSPKDMDFMETKNSAARDIALAFGVPPHLLGIKGDNTYSNMQEARLAFWEETIIPLIDKTVDALNNWLVPFFSNDLRLSYDLNKISALSDKQEKLWQRISKADFMTNDEKRAALGLSSQYKI